jgi:Na+-transporting methylmalonyl-CoA/oxaloacetate decarboxylase gamma subunit
MAEGLVTSMTMGVLVQQSPLQLTDETSVPLGIVIGVLSFGVVVAWKVSTLIHRFSGRMDAEERLQKQLQREVRDRLCVVEERLKQLEDDETD